MTVERVNSFLVQPLEMVEAVVSASPVNQCQCLYNHRDLMQCSVLCLESRPYT